MPGKGKWGWGAWPLWAAAYGKGRGKGKRPSGPNLKREVVENAVYTMIFYSDQFFSLSFGCWSEGLSPPLSDESKCKQLFQRMSKRIK